MFNINIYNSAIITPYEYAITAPLSRKTLPVPVIQIQIVQTILQELAVFFIAVKTQNDSGAAEASPSASSRPRATGQHGVIAELSGG